MFGIDGLLQLDRDLLIGLVALAIGASAALLGIWLGRDKDRPVFWALALTALICAATGVGLVETWVDHFDTEQLEEDVARMLTTLVRMADQTNDLNLQALVEDQLGRSSNDVAERMQIRMGATEEPATNGIPIAHDWSLLDMFKGLPILLEELGFELWVALAAVVVAGLAAMLGVWIEKDPDGPWLPATTLSMLVLLATAVALLQTMTDVADSEQLEADVANMLVALDAIAQKGTNSDLDKYLAQEMQAQARANPKVLEKVQQNTAEQGGDPNALLARHLPAAELAGMGLIQAAKVAKSMAAEATTICEPSVANVCVFPEENPVRLSAVNESARFNIIANERRLVIIEEGVPLIVSGHPSNALETKLVGQAFTIDSQKDILSTDSVMNLIRIPNSIFINFVQDSSEISPIDAGKLDQLVKALTSFAGSPSLHIVGHSDSVGRQEHNQDLSLARAIRVADYLKSSLNEGVIIQAEGVGSDFPLPGLEASDKENRRVEIKVQIASDSI